MLRDCLLFAISFAVGHLVARAWRAYRGSLLWKD
jgi:hypothetical protein